MNNTIWIFITVIIIAIAQVVLSNTNKRKYWFLGGIIPLALLAVGIYGVVCGKIDSSLLSIVKIIVFPIIISLLIWADGYAKTKKKELEKMYAKDID
ncbi:undecaprenyl pyrophosphate phosphatase UppP [Clostridium tetanomorphum]|uniref:hypothetical protein n=1 Tax=Clostridium tetanomorphum TaxID=1553 RepID=UPI00044AF7B7|nr:hypothetical protein [Clostridium tetanomorphum]KAJ49628.1 hypothetical protein CTM_22083 [Clostridium tetanomorphum DSM 665]KAJ52438.1 hypothetical protein CTM_08066 [Clostridium tetanomorphum DSM 665]MBP1864723.1 undecaprenyl pyrophosphate phosphatase UppP [Clostridium tetanomorphum]NRS83900.1 undecaprenyl pyrophosphate phosphatase UppP [Clostridium tetanomorphum]SQB93153.1 Uncharacterised protein [Clostridium tetanomorphum]